MINTIILDIGNVLARFGWKDYFLKKGYQEELIKRVSASTVLSEAWKEWDRGSVTRDEMADICCQYDKEISSEIRQFFHDLYTIVEEFDFAQEFVQKLKESGYKIYLLSNFNGEHYLYCKERFKFIQYIDGSVISYEVNYVKPESQIYQILLNKYNINPLQAVFLDDMEENLEAAKFFGLHTIHVTDHEQALLQLRKLGLRI